jgi:hypothetical protein
MRGAGSRSPTHATHGVSCLACTRKSNCPQLAKNNLIIRRCKWSRREDTPPIASEVAFVPRFCQIFLELKRSLVADEPHQPTPKRVLGETLLMTVFADPETASTPCFDVQRPPFASRLVLEVFGPTGESPQQQRTRNGTASHEGEDVQRPDAYAVA